MQNQPWENCKSGEIYYAEKERELSFPAFRNDFCTCSCNYYRFDLHGSCCRELQCRTEHAVTSDGVELANGDIVYAGLDENGFTHGMIKAVEISVDYNGDVQTVSLAKGTVADVLERTGITPAYNEVVEPHFQLRFRIISLLRFTRAKSFNYGWRQNRHCLCSERQCLRCPQSAWLQAFRWRYSQRWQGQQHWGRRQHHNQACDLQERNRNSVGDFETVKKNSKDVDLGKTKVQTEGKQGEALVTKKCKYVDGKKVSSKTVDTKITKEPIDKVVLMGTKG